MNKFLDCLTVDTETQMFMDEFDQTEKALEEHLKRSYVGRTLIHGFGRYKGRECEVIDTMYFNGTPHFQVKTKRSDKFGYLENQDDYHRRYHPMSSFKRSTV